MVKQILGPSQGTVRMDNIYHPDWHTARGLVCFFCTQGEGAIHIRKLLRGEGRASEGFVVDFTWLENEVVVSALHPKRLGGAVYGPIAGVSSALPRARLRERLPATDSGFAGAALVVRACCCNDTVIGYHSLSFARDDVQLGHAVLVIGSEGRPRPAQTARSVYRPFGSRRCRLLDDHTAP